MMIDNISASPLNQQAKFDQPVEDVEQNQQKATDQTQADSSEQQQVQSEELLNQIKSLTEDGTYSVRFEQNSDIDELVVKVVDTETDEVIRQIPPEDLVNLSKHLQELRGNIVDTVS